MLTCLHAYMLTCLHVYMQNDIINELANVVVMANKSQIVLLICSKKFRPEKTSDYKQTGHTRTGSDTNTKKHRDIYSLDKNMYEKR